MSNSILTKLASMSMTEVVFRSKTLWSGWYDERLYALGFGRDPAPQVLPGEEARIGNLWLSSSDLEQLRPKLLDQSPEYVDEIRRLADAICNHQFLCLGVPVEYGPQVEWNADPLSRNPWPSLFHSRVDIFGGDTGCGDVKYVWEINRHQFLAVLGKAYCLTANEKYAVASLNLIEDWIQMNPYKAGVNWASGLEVAIRSLSWIWLCNFILHSNGLTTERQQRIVRSLYQHGHYLEEHLSFFFSPYNHLIGEATALLALGTAMPFLSCAARWREKGWEILEKELANQFHPDGGCVEQALGYHHFTLGFYLQAMRCQIRQGKEISPFVWSRLEKAFEYSMFMMRPDGLVPMIGDGDEGQAFHLHQVSLWDFRPYLAIGAILYQRGDFKRVAGDFPADIAWLVGFEGCEQFESLAQQHPREQSKALTYSGYYIMRTNWDADAHYLNFDCGEIAHGVPLDERVSAAHGHADVFSFELSVYGKPFIIDPGFYTYNGSVEWHRYFRETLAHNTLVVDERSQAQYAGRLKWSSGPKAVNHHWMSSSVFDYVEGFHDGYRGLPEPVNHRRAVAFVKPYYWLIWDILEGEGEHLLDQYFHFSPGTRIRHLEKGGISANNGEHSNLAIIPLVENNMEILIRDDGTNPGDGWVATGYDKKTSAPVALFREQTVIPKIFQTLLLPFNAELPAIEIDWVLRPSNDLSHQGHAFVVRSQARYDLFIFRGEEDAKEIAPGYVTDSRVAVVQRSPSLEVTALAMIAGSTLEVEGQVLLTLSKRINHVAVSFQNGRSLVELSEPVEISTVFSNPQIIIHSQED